MPRSRIYSLWHFARKSCQNLMCKYRGNSRRTLEHRPRLHLVSCVQKSLTCILTLEVASRILLVASECDLWNFLFQKISNLPVCNLADLVILLDNFSILVAHTASALWHQCVASFVGLADVAIDSTPSFVALAVLVCSKWTILSICQRTTDYAKLTKVPRRKTASILPGSRHASPPKPAGQLHLPSYC